MNAETPIVQRIRLAIGSRNDARIFRNSCGFDAESKVRYGLCNGSSDLIGWTTVTLAGRRVAVFTALEVKRPNGGRLSVEQASFLAAVRDAGGIAAVVTSPEDAISALTNHAI